jgi:hypothetical protein
VSDPHPAVRHASIRDAEDVVCPKRKRAVDAGRRVAQEVREATTNRRPSQRERWAVVPDARCRETRGLAGFFQGFDQKEDFGGYSVVPTEFRRVDEGAIAAAGDDGLEGADKRTKCPG